jgi:hypothetical protein
MPLLYASIERVCVCARNKSIVCGSGFVCGYGLHSMIRYRRLGGIGSRQRVILPSDISSSLFFLLFCNEASGISMIHTRPRRKHDRMCMCRGA